MQFIADSQFIISVWAAGFRKLVIFDERGDSGVASYVTDDPIVAQAIRNTRYFKQGRIQEDMSKSDLTPEGETSGTVATKPEGKASGTEPKPSGTEQKQQGDASQNATEPEVKKFSSITFAKNYLAKEFGIDKKTLKTPEQVMAAAEAQGVKIEF